MINAERLEELSRGLVKVEKDIITIRGEVTSMKKDVNEFKIGLSSIEKLMLKIGLAIIGTLFSIVGVLLWNFVLMK